MALPKLFQRIFFHNNATPALNEDNLNAMSKGLSDVDDRLIELAGTIMEDVPTIQHDLEVLEPAIENIDANVERAENAADNAEADALKSEGYAIGEQDGVEVGPESEYYQKNAKYFAEIANPPIENTVDFADIITVTDAINKAAKDVRLKIEAVQDLHGYAHPWVGGAGKNLYNKEAPNVSSVANKTSITQITNGIRVTAVESSSYLSTAQIVIDDLTSYVGKSITFKCKYTHKSSDGILCALQALKDGTAVLWDTMNGIDGEAWTTVNITSAHAEATLYFRFYISGSNTISVGDYTEYTEIQIEVGTTATSYEPYENICPISGWDNAKVTRVAHQLWDEEWELGTINYNTGAPDSADDRIRSKNYIPLVANTSYYLRMPTGKGNIFYYFYDIDKQYLGVYDSTNASLVLPIPQNARYMKLRATSNYGTTYNHDICINVSDPSFNGQYEPYQGEELTISLNGTRYGGTLDVTSGVLTVDRVYGSGTVTGINDSYANITYGTFDKAADSAAKGNYNKFDILSSMFYSPTTEPSNWNNAANVGGIFMTASTNLYWVGFPKGTTQAEMETATADHKIVYKLATPQTIQLTPTQVYLLYGYNTLFGDCGDISLTYDASGIVHINEAKLDTETLKTIAAASSDFADFKARIAAL